VTLRLTLYYREGCHLCDDMAFALGQLLDPSVCSLERVDIDRDVTLRQRFHADVPVLCHGGEVICKHFLDRERLDKVLGESH